MLRKISHIGILHKKLFVSMMLSASVSFVPKKVVNAKKYDEVFDLAVIGGGSGGLSTAF